MPIELCIRNKEESKFLTPVPQLIKIDLEGLSMTVHLNSIPTGNPRGAIDLRVTFMLNKKSQGTLNVGGAETLTLGFDSIGVGTSEPMAIYRQETPGNITISPGSVAFVERSVDSKIALRYGSPGGIQQNIVFVR